MGLLIALSIILLWLAHLVYVLVVPEVVWTSVFTYLHMAVQTYLYTGLFITGHDAMHGLVSPNPKLNRIVGTLATWLFAALSYSRLQEKHKLHHRFPGEEADPDYCAHSQNFFIWWFSFLKNYIKGYQILIMAVVFNVLQIWVDQWNLLVFWVLPSILSTFQLFYFGTYLPHRMPHSEAMLPHNSRTQTGPHWWAMLSCYFFGYHFEHHDSPRTPWWKLYQLKNLQP